MPEFQLKLVDEAEVVQTRGREAKPTLADDFGKLIESQKIVDLIKANKKSPYYLTGGFSENVIRSAAKFHGYRVNFAKNKAGDPVFRFAGPYVEMAADVKAERDRKRKATLAAKAAAEPKAASTKAKAS